MTIYVTQLGTTIQVDPTFHDAHGQMYPSGFRGEYAFLSNFSNCNNLVVPNLRRFPGWMRGKLATNVENAFQAAKFAEPPTPNIMKEFGFVDDLGVVQPPEAMLSTRPAVSKRMGRVAALPDDWDTRSIEIMEALLLAKFDDPNLREQLLRTGDVYIIEWNLWFDSRWGVPSRTKTGANILGQLLMAVRERLKAIA